MELPMLLIGERDALAVRFLDLFSATDSSRTVKKNFSVRAPGALTIGKFTFIGLAYPALERQLLHIAHASPQE
jgi:hypothetical protein